MSHLYVDCDRDMPRFQLFLYFSVSITLKCVEAKVAYAARSSVHDWAVSFPWKDRFRIAHARLILRFLSSIETLDNVERARTPACLRSRDRQFGTTRTRTPIVSLGVRVFRRVFLRGDLSCRNDSSSIDDDARAIADEGKNNRVTKARQTRQSSAASNIAGSGSRSKQFARPPRPLDCLLSFA